ncbi:MAG TPA: FtsH protease activity modulator HflK [Alphaproteobacteria bacterium]|nr:FtsH protease activity modulator HflK [Alphaproteobacteria bacterium]
MSPNQNGPWGGDPPKNNGPKRPAPNDVDVEEWLRKGREQLRRAFPPNPDDKGRRFWSFIAIVAGFFWLVSGFYQISPNQAGVVQRFGKVVRVEQAGLHYHLPAPIETVLLPDITSVNQLKIGDGGPAEEGDDQQHGSSSESRMLTGDENIVDMDFSVFWRVKDPVDFLFNIRNPQLTLKLLSESAMREVVGKMEIQPILTEKRSQIEAEAAELIQTMLDDYKSGITVMQVQLMNVSPPQPVVDAFNDVQRARADAERLHNEAQAYANDILPRAKGEAQKMLQDALGYKEKVIAVAKGDASRFESVQKIYSEARDVTATRLYFETMEDVLSGANKIILDPSAAKSGAVPYMSLPELMRKPAAGEAQ